MAEPKTLSKTEIFELYMSSKNWKPNNTHGLFAIAFIGLPGTGKSYISKKLSNLLNVPICSNDEIRRFLNELGYSGESPNQDLVEFIAVKRADYLFRSKISHIKDADLIAFQKSARQRSRKYNAKLYVIKIVANEEIALERLRERRGTGDSFSRAGVKKYFERKKLHETIPVGEVSMTIETNPESNVDEQLDTLRKLLIRDNVL